MIPQTYAQSLATEKKGKRINIPSIIVELKTDDKNNMCSTNLVKQVLHEKTTCPIRKVKEVNNKVFIKCNSYKDVDKVSDILVNSEKLNINVDIGKMKSPRIIVVGVDPCMINTPNVSIGTDIYNRNGIDKNQQI
ncbi:hypothetical protein QAD02_007922 [Eretmocerus hayati]|uniref:Uncharacterized protein n=1 Tax=Eretmocerus hayati TaxID=131215 RepID=A0ACC2N500_9HYME|nr:hypothetical protein QAD02_007922 [Eretmocerus hayati]